SAQPAPFPGRMPPRRPFAPPMPPRDDADQQPKEVGNQIDRTLPLHRQIDQCIERGVKYLLDHQRDDGSWDGEGMRMGQEAGKTALAGLALLSCGVSHQSPQITKAIAFLKKARIEDSSATYSTA